MKNANKPAYPHTKRWLNENVSENLTDGGLTKREMFAMAAMQGMLSSGRGIPDGDFIPEGSFESFSREAIRYADELLKQLEK